MCNVVGSPFGVSIATQTALNNIRKLYLSNYASFSDAISAVSMLGKSLIIDQPFDLEGANVDCLGVGLVWISEGNVISNGTININGCHITAGRFKIFNDDVTLLGTPDLTPVEEFEPSSKEYTDTKVSLTDNETIDGIKIFNSPINGSITGNASTATKLATPRKITLSGDVSGSVSIDGSTDVTLSTQVANDSHVHSTSTITGLDDALASKVDKVAGKGLSDTNYTQAEKDKLAGLESSRFKGQYASLAALQAAFPVASVGDYANVDEGAGHDVARYVWDTSDTAWIKQLGISSQLTAAQIKQEYESNPDTNVFSDDKKTKLNGIQAGAQVNTVTSVAGKTGDVTLVKEDVGLSNVDNVKQAPITRTITTGTGLSGGGNLTADRTLSVAYGTTAGTSAQGNDSRLSNSREWTATTITQAEAEAGTATIRRAWTAQRVRQAANSSIAAQSGIANGIASLDGNAKIPLAQLSDSIVGQVEYMGIWNASTNTPTLPATPAEKGHYYVVSVSGTRFGHSFEVGDWIISNGASWDKVDNTDAVSSVNGRTGNVSGLAESNDPRFTDSREWTASTVSQAEAEAGTATTRRAFTAQRLRQGIVAWFNGISGALGRTILSRTTAAQVRSDIELGTAATKNVGTGPGNVMDVGAFGLGGKNTDFTGTDLEISDFSLQKTVGFYAVGNSVLDAPTNWSFHYKGSLIVTVEGGVGDRINQVAIQGANIMRIWFRGQGTDGTWSPWREILHTGNILQTTGTSTNFPMSQKATTDVINTKVGLTGNQTINGIKTFTSSPIVPIPTTNFQSVPLRSTNITVDVGAGQTYTTINQALAYLSGFYPRYKRDGVTATINLKAGFVMAEQVLVRGINLGWITIVGEDAETAIDNTALTINFSYADYGISAFPVFGVSKGGTLPRIGHLFRFNATDVGGAKHGVMAVGAGSSAEIAENKGVKDAGANGIYAARGSTINADSAVASGAGTYGIYAARGSTINANDADASEAGTYGIYAFSGSTITAHRADASGAGTYGFSISQGATINANESTGTLSQPANTLTSSGIIYQ